MKSGKKPNSIYKFQKEQINYSKDHERWKYSDIPFCRHLVEHGKSKEKTEEIYEYTISLIKQQRKNYDLEQENSEMKLDQPKTEIENPKCSSLTSSRKIDIKQNNDDNIFPNHR